MNIAPRTGAFGRWTPEMMDYCAARHAVPPRPSSMVIADLMAAQFGVDVRDFDVRSWRRYKDRRKPLQEVIEREGDREGIDALLHGADVQQPEPEAAMYRDLWERYEESIRVPPPKHSRDLALAWLEKGDRTIGVLSDTHHPFQDQALLDEWYRRNPKLDAVILNGDILNLDSLSRFVSYTAERPEDDIEAHLRLNEELAQRYPDVPVFELEGNHGNRLRKHTAQHMDPVIAHAFMSSLNETLARPFPNHHALPSDWWWLRIGDVLFTHGEKKAGGNNWKQPVENFYRYFTNYAARHSTPWPRAIVQGHHHRLGKLAYNGTSAYLFYAGTFSKELEYSTDSAMFSSASQDQGYVIIRMHNGRVIGNDSHIFDFADMKR